MSFEYKNKIILYNKSKGESNNLYYDKGYYIAKNLNDTNNFDDLVIEANIIFNKKYLGCKYNNKINNNNDNNILKSFS
jgi:hypothetical protein